jgi:hypothetical protein
MRSFRSSVALAALLVLAAASTAVAQDIRTRLKLTIPQGLATQAGHFPRGAPGTSTGSPIAFGAQKHDAFVGVGFQQVRYSTDTDGGATLGFGIGNAKQVGVEVDINALSTIRSGVGNRVGFGAKVHRVFTNNWGAAVGVSNIIVNKNGDDSQVAIYGVVSKVVDVNHKGFQALTFSGGLGTEGFQSESKLAKGDNGVGFFGSAAVRMASQFSLIADMGQSLSLGASIVPVKKWPLVLTPAFADLTGSAGARPGFRNSRSVRFTLGAGFAFKY